MKNQILPVVLLLLCCSQTPAAESGDRPPKRTARGTQAAGPVEGTPSAIQAAINSCADGGTVEIANGTYTWTSGITIGKPIILKGQTKGGVKIISSGLRTNTITVTEPHSAKLEIANIDFQFTKGNDVFVYAVAVYPPNDRGSGRVLLHDCVFVTNYAYAVSWETNGGVIWNCDFDGRNSGGLSGVQFVPRELGKSWQTLSTFGTDDHDGLTNTYVEDCTFRGTSVGCTNLDDNSRVVVRHCVIDNSGMSSHGQETSPEGNRHWEIYDNKFSCDSDNRYNVNYYIQCRGGTGVITDNDFQEIPWNKSTLNLCVFSIRRQGQIPCQTSYPAARQIGQGWKGAGGYDYPSVPRDGTGYFTDPIYIWGNTGGGTGANFIYLNEYNPDECGNDQRIANYVKEGRDFKKEARPGYEKYPYPHPLRTGGGGGGPTPTPPQPTPTATPQPTASPSATPQPTATPPVEETYRKWLDNLSNWIRQHPAIPDPQ